MAIKIAPRAKVSSDFPQVILEQTRIRLEKMTEEYEAYGERSRLIFIKQNAGLIALLKKMLSDPAAVDMAVTRLRSMPFSKFLVETHFNSCASVEEPYFMGVTTPITLDYTTPSRGHEYDAGTYDMGEYAICIPTSDFGKGKMQLNGYGRGADTHFIPVKNPSTPYRFMHHKTSFTGNSRNPFQSIPDTCWGGYGAIAVGAISDCDVPAFFRACHSYLTRFDDNSVLTRLGNCEHIVRIS